LINKIKTFLESPKESEIYDILGVNDDEIKILQFMLDKYLDGREIVRVRYLIKEVFKIEKIESLKYIKNIVHLINEGWIFDEVAIPGKKYNLLEIYNSSVSLTKSFLDLFDSAADKALPENKPYKEQFELLEDEFLRIGLYQKLATFRKKGLKNNFAVKKIKEELNLVENIIEERIKKSQIHLPIVEFIEENELNKKEEIIFFALLKAEYLSAVGLRTPDVLLELISEDSKEKLKNVFLLDEESKLMKEDIIEYEEVFTSLKGFKKQFFIKEEVINKIIHQNKKEYSIENIVKDTLFEVVNNKISLDDVVLPKETMEIIKNFLKQNDKKVIQRLKKWGIKKNNEISSKIIFYGPPGTGKTMTANLIANELNKPLLTLDVSKILSMYVGESEKNVKKLFDEYYEISEKLGVKPVLLLNEADQFLSTRTTSSLNSVDKMHNQMQNIFLEEFEKFDGVLIATTNLLETLDNAFSRRFDFKVKFEKPPFKERVKLWDLKLPKNAEYEEDFDVNILAKYELSPAQIELIIKNTALKVAIKSKPLFTIKDFIQEIEKEVTNAFDSEKEIGFKL